MKKFKPYNCGASAIYTVHVFNESLGNENVPTHGQSRVIHITCLYREYKVTYSKVQYLHDGTKLGLDWLAPVLFP